MLVLKSAIAEATSQGQGDPNGNSTLAVACNKKQFSFLDFVSTCLSLFVLAVLELVHATISFIYFLTLNVAKLISRSFLILV